MKNILKVLSVVLSLGSAQALASESNFTCAQQAQDAAVNVYGAEKAEKSTHISTLLRTENVLAINYVIEFRTQESEDADFDGVIHAAYSLVISKATCDVYSIVRTR